MPCPDRSNISCVSDTACIRRLASGCIERISIICHGRCKGRRPIWNGTRWRKPSDIDLPSAADVMHFSRTLKVLVWAPERLI